MIEEILPPETARAFPAMHELRPHFGDPRDFARWVDERQRPEGYRLVGVFTGDREAAAVAGFRLGTSLSWGRHLYIDDLSTLPTARRRGFAGQLLAWIQDEARRLDCQEVHLDSGVGATRRDAHRLYLNSGFSLTAHHFVRTV